VETGRNRKPANVHHHFWRGEKKVISQFRALEVAVLILAAATFASAGGKGHDSDQADPITKVLNQGVDQINDAAAPAPQMQQRDPRYRLEKNDVLSLEFEFTPEFNQAVTVQPDGFVTLKDVGDVKVEGKTLPEFRQYLQTAYAKILAKPVISITLKEFDKPYFLALGQVEHPGKYELRGETTLTAAVAMAGGFTTNAKHSQVLLFRRVSGEWASVRKIDLKQMLKSGNLSEDVHLSPGDMLYIPQNTLSKVKPFVPLPSWGMMAPIP
jgi:polysaccharide export outer membrane protein